MMEIGNEQFCHDPLLSGTNDLQELSKTHAMVSRPKTELWHRVLTHYLPLYFAILQRANSFSDKFERYFAKDGHNIHLRRKAYTAIAAKMARTVHAVIKGGEPYHPVFEGATDSRRTFLCKGRGGRNLTS